MSLQNLQAQLMPEIQSQIGQLNGQQNLQGILQQLINDPTKSPLYGSISSNINQNYNRQRQSLLDTLAGTGQLRSGNVGNSIASLEQGRDMSLANLGGSLGQSAIGELLGLNEFNQNMQFNYSQMQNQNDQLMGQGIGTLVGSLLPYLLFGPAGGAVGSAMSYSGMFNNWNSNPPVEGWYPYSTAANTNEYSY